MHENTTYSSCMMFFFLEKGRKNECPQLEMSQANCIQCSSGDLRPLPPHIITFYVISTQKRGLSFPQARYSKRPSKNKYRFGWRWRRFQQTLLLFSRHCFFYLERILVLGQFDFSWNDKAILNCNISVKISKFRLLREKQKNSST